MPLWLDPTNLPPEKAAEFDRAEGTLEVGGTLQEPLAAPDKLEAIFFFETPAKTLVTIELDERLRFYFRRRAPDMPAAYAVVDATSLAGVPRVAIQCSWSPLGLQIRVTDLESGDSVSSEPAG
jgi:hypothetical protein